MCLNIIYLLTLQNAMYFTPFICFWSNHPHLPPELLQGHPSPFAGAESPY